MKGQVYTIIAVLIAIPIILFATQYLTFSQIPKGLVSEKIVSDQIHQVEKSIQQDFEKVLESTTKRALIASIGEVIMNGRPLSNAKANLMELIENGTINGSENYIMTNNTLRNWTNFIKNIQINFNFSLNYSDLDVNNYDGFNLNVSSIFYTEVRDSILELKVNKTVQKQVLVSLEGLEDPLFPLNTGGFIKRTIKKYPYPFYTKKVVVGTNSLGNCTGNVSFDINDPNKSEKILIIYNASGISGFLGVVGETNDLPNSECYIVGASNAVNLVNETINQINVSEVYLDQETKGVWSLPLKIGIEEKYYYQEDGPDFFQRLENKTGSSINNNGRGLETFVYIPELEDVKIPINSRSRVDYLYFSNETYSIDNIKSVRGFPEWFKIDINSAGKYNLTELLE